MRIDWDLLPAAVGMRPGSVRKAVAADRLSAVRVVTEADAVFDGRLHKHSHEQLLVMLAGSVQLQIGEDQFWANPGDVVFFPSGVAHGAVGVGDSGCEYIEIFAPPRIDQLPGFIGSDVLEYV